MIVKKNIKLELEFKFFLRSSLRIQITNMSDIIQNIKPNTKLHTDPDGFIIDTGYVFTYNRHNFTIPIYMDYECSYNDSNLYAYFNFMSDNDRYNSIKRLYRYMQKLSQSKIFQYDNTGYVNVNDSKWILY